MASRRVYGMVEALVDAAPLDDLVLKGFNHPVLAMEILRWRGDSAEASMDMTQATDAAPADLAAKPARRRKGT